MEGKNMPVVATDIADLVAGTLRDLGRMKFEQISQELQDYEVMQKWLQRDKVQFDSGIGIQRNLMTKTAGAAEHVGLMDTDNADIPDLMDQLQVNWVHAQTKWAFAYQEVLMNRGESLIFNVVKPRRVASMIDMAALLESSGWSVPAVGSKTEPNGLPYYIVFNTSTGFNGGLPGSHTTVANVNLTESPTYKNYTVQYAAVTKADLVKKLRTMARKVGWRPVVSTPDYSKPYGAGARYRLYTDEVTISAIEDIGEAQNENLGRDIAPMGAATDFMTVDQVLTFRKYPIVWVPQLDDTSVFTAATNPVYLVDHSTFYPICLKGDFLRESPPRQAPNQHNVYRVFVDLTYNHLCINRRRNGVAAK
jgi:hypothetical protein